MASYNVEINRYKASGNTYDQLLPKPSKHKSSHAKGGADALTPSDIGAPTIEQFNELKNSVSEGKALVARAVTDKGVQTAPTATFQTIANNIRSISAGGYAYAFINKTRLENNGYVDLDLGVELKNIRDIKIWGWSTDNYENVTDDNPTALFQGNGRGYMLKTSQGAGPQVKSELFTYSGNQIIMPFSKSIATVTGTKLRYQYKAGGRQTQCQLEICVLYPIE